MKKRIFLLIFSLMMIFVGMKTNYVYASSLKKLDAIVGDKINFEYSLETAGGIVDQFSLTDDFVSRLNENGLKLKNTEVGRLDHEIFYTPIRNRLIIEGTPIRSFADACTINKYKLEKENGERELIQDMQELTINILENTSITDDVDKVNQNNAITNDNNTINQQDGLNSDQNILNKNQGNSIDQLEDSNLNQNTLKENDDNTISNEANIDKESGLAYSLNQVFKSGDTIDLGTDTKTITLVDTMDRIITTDTATNSYVIPKFATRDVDFEIVDINQGIKLKLKSEPTFKLTIENNDSVVKLSKDRDIKHLDEVTLTIDDSTIAEEPILEVTGCDKSQFTKNGKNFVATLNNFIDDATIKVTIPTQNKVTIKVNGGVIQGTQETEKEWNVGENITVVADEIEDKEFDGWYKGDVKLSDEKIYTFPATENSDIIAKYTDKTIENESDGTDEFIGYTILGTVIIVTFFVGYLTNFIVMQHKPLENNNLNNGVNPPSNTEEPKD